MKFKIEATVRLSGINVATFSVSFSTWLTKKTAKEGTFDENLSWKPKKNPAKEKKRSTYLSVWAVFVSRFKDEIRIGIFFDLIDEFSLEDWFWLNWTELRERMTKLSWLELLLPPLCELLFFSIDRVFAYSNSS